MRYFIVITILSLLNSYVVIGLTSRFLSLKHPIAFTIIIIIGLIIFQSVGLLEAPHVLLKIEQKLNLNGLVLFLTRASYLMIGVLSCLFFYSLASDIIRIILRLVLSASSSVYIYFDKFCLPVIILITLLTLILGIVVTIVGPVVQKVEIYLENLPASFDKFTIVQISDLHVGSTIKNSYVAKVVNIANALKPNLIALTGDFVDGRVKDLKDDVAPLAQLKSTHGKFFVTGNHEYYSGAEEWINEFSNLGINTLSNEHVLLTNDNEHIILAGVTDYSTINKKSKNASNPNQAIAGAVPGLIKILLAHQPSSYIEAHKAGFDLQLSGHTHAGQYFPFTLLIRFFHRYYKGLNWHEGMWIYINRGTGYWGPPLRIGAPAEITLIVLRGRPH